jgi:hypothetical protein
MDGLSRNSKQGVGRRSTPGRQDERRAPRLPPAHPSAPPLRPAQAATDLLYSLLGPMRWLGAAKGSDLSEAWGGKPGDVGWLLELPGGGRLAITVSRRLGLTREDARVVLFQEVCGYGGLTWCLPADTPEHFVRLRAEVESLLADGAQVAKRTT